MKSDRRPHARARMAAASARAEFAGEAVAVIAAAPAAGGPPRFTAVAYTGKPMRPKLTPPLEHPVVVDLAGLDVGPASLPALRDHDPRAVVGHHTSVTTDGMRVNAAGVLSGTGPAAREVIANARNGYRWQTSIGADLTGIYLVDAGRTVTVNGRVVPGPVYVARGARLREISFLSLGADDDTAATIAAAAAKDSTMTFDEWLRANGFDPAAVSTKQRVRLYAMYGGEQATATARAAAGDAPATFEAWLTAGGFDPAAEGDDALDEAQTAVLRAAFDARPKPRPANRRTPPHRQPTPPARRRQPARATVAAGAGEEGDDDPAGDDGEGDDERYELRDAIADMRAMRREAAVHRICGDRHAAIAAQAIAGGWSDGHVRSAVQAAELQAQLPQTVMIRTGRAADAPPLAVVIEAAVCQAGGMADAEKRFGARAMEEANRQFCGRIGLQELFMEAAIANGYAGRTTRAIGSDLSGVLAAAMRAPQSAAVQAGGFSTFSLPGILSNTANKFLLMGFMGVEDTWREIASTRPVSDFKGITSYRLTGGFEYEEVAPDGMLKHGQVGEESYTNQAKTYGKMFVISRQDLINDDLGALTAVPQRLGRGAKLKFNKVFWGSFMNNAAFFAAGLNNYFAGAASNLSIDSLTTAEALFLNQVDGDGNPVAIAPEVLLVPNALSTLATSLTRDTEIRNPSTSSTYSVTNPHAGKFRTVRSSYLSNPTLTGYSTAAWYLLGGPGSVPVIEVVFLNGKQEPTVESADADFNVLGVQMRGYHDFGVAKQDPRGGVKSKGSA